MSTWEAAAAGDLGRLDECLAASPGALNQKDSLGWTPLMYAAKFGREAAARWLLAKGARADVCSINGHTARSLAAVFNHSSLSTLFSSSLQLLRSENKNPTITETGPNYFSSNGLYR